MLKMKCTAISCKKEAEYVFCGQSLCQGHFKKKVTEVNKLIKEGKK